ncbi:MAG: hypothetical protein D6772_05960 [Bacteroidetes bacterium]|nr:MAG: hypothetical protein D6772_05960 [Bacteroidota bacterium]
MLAYLPCLKAQLGLQAPRLEDSIVAAPSSTFRPLYAYLPLRAAQRRYPLPRRPALRQLFGPSQLEALPVGNPAAPLAFFCRLELKIENATRMPVRFRLGSSQYVDYLEGKFEGWRYGY